MQRRTFLQGLGAAMALRTIPRPALGLARSAHDAKHLQRIGVQLYTLRDAARADLTGTLRDIAAIGFKEVELLDSMRNFGMPAAKLRATLDSLGLRAPSTHIDTAALDQIPRLVDEAHALGHQYVIVASLPLDPKTVSLDDYRRWADRFNTAGQKIRASGLWLGFHDEAENFKPIDGKIPYDVMIERLDPKVVRLQLDTGNAAIGGRDPSEYMEHHADRYFLFHIKDAPKLGAANDSELGTGVVNFKKIIDRAGPLGNKHFYIEQESYPGAPIDSVKRDYAYLSKLEL
jgi:sugar phosphate isomerase/epimerase